MAADAPDRMVRSAEKLFAEHGIEHPSLREISRHAGQGNTRAVQYHFGTRERLLEAVLLRHRDGIEARRLELLDAPDHDARSLAGVLAQPLIEKLDDRDHGQEYLQIAAEVVNHPLRFHEVVHLVGAGEAMDRWAAATTPHMDADAVGSPLHRRSATVRFVYNEIARRARERRSDDHRLFQQQLEDIVVAMLAAPVSDQTRALLGREGVSAVTRR